MRAPGSADPPAAAPRAAVADSLHISAKLGLRTLRMGYLYVLLDQQVWHGYEVSAQGHLRYFNPYEPQDGPPSPLQAADVCLRLLQTCDR
ncbi:toxin VasX [Pseudomonas sp. CM25]|uniref:toxin VasX n=1 Tax=Pseudomonas sp. CM25 TaxID=2738448 RepID=UPI00355801FB